MKPHRLAVLTVRTVLLCQEQERLIGDADGGWAGTARDGKPNLLYRGEHVSE